MHVYSESALRKIQEVIDLELRPTKGVQLLFSSRITPEDKRLYSQLESIGDALLRVALLRGSPADKAVSKLDQLQSNVTLTEIAQRHKCATHFCGSASDALECLFALVFEQEGYEKAIDVILALYREKKYLPQKADEAMNLRLVDALAGLVFRLYIRTMYPETESREMNIRAKCLCKGNILKVILEKAFEGETSERLALLRYCHYEGFEPMQTRILSALPTTAADARHFVEKYQPTDVRHF